MKSLILLALCATLLQPVKARAEEPITLDDLGVDVCTTYFWRGYQIVDHPALQPVASASLANTPLSLSGWGSLTLGDRNNHKQVDELDLTFSAAHDAKLGERTFALEAGAVVYTFPEAPKGTRRSAEVFASVSPDAVLAPTLSYFYDFDQWDASYLSFALAPEIGLGGESTLTITPSVGFGDTDQAFGFQDATVTTSTTFSWRGLDWTPALGFTHTSRNVNADRGGVWGMIGLRIPR